MTALLTVSDVAERLSVHVATVRRMVRAGKIPASDIAGQFRFEARDVEAYIEAQRVRPTVPTRRRRRRAA